MSYKILFYFVLAIIVVGSLVFGPRIVKGIQLKQDKKETYAIQNIGTNKCIRPQNANFHNDIDVILYDLNNWECLTWQFIDMGENTFLLKNLYTEKTFQPKSGSVEGSSMWQKPVGGSQDQYWEFLVQSDGIYLIRLKGTMLYLTASSKEQNAKILLKPLDGSDRQLWKLVKQSPIV